MSTRGIRFLLDYGRARADCEAARGAVARLFGGEVPGGSFDGEGRPNTVVAVLGFCPVAGRSLAPNPGRQWVELASVWWRANSDSILAADPTDELRELILADGPVTWARRFRLRPSGPGRSWRGFDLPRVSYRAGADCVSMADLAMEAFKCFLRGFVQSRGGSVWDLHSAVGPWVPECLGRLDVFVPEAEAIVLAEAEAIERGSQ